MEFACGRNWVLFLRYLILLVKILCHLKYWWVIIEEKLKKWTNWLHMLMWVISLVLLIFFYYHPPNNWLPYMQGCCCPHVCNFLVTNFRSSCSTETPGLTPLDSITLNAANKNTDQSLSDLLSAMTHIRQICGDFFIMQFFCSRPLFIAQFFVTKNTACVNGTIEITLEQIQCDIATSKMPQIHLMCVMALTGLSVPAHWLF